VWGIVKKHLDVAEAGVGTGVPYKVCTGVQGCPTKYAQGYRGALQIMHRGTLQSMHRGALQIMHRGILQSMQTLSVHVNTFVNAIICRWRGFQRF